MLVNEIFTLSRSHKWRQRLNDRGWFATTVPREYRNSQAPGYSIDFDLQGVGGPLQLFHGNRRIATLYEPPDPFTLSRVQEAIMSELESVAMPENRPHEIGSGGKSVDPHIDDMLPHNPIKTRNQAPPYADIFAKATGKAHNDSFAFETPPSSGKLPRRRNNDAGIKRLDTVSAKGDANALLHKDYAGRKPFSNVILPGQ